MPEAPHRTWSLLALLLALAAPLLAALGIGGVHPASHVAIGVVALLALFALLLDLKRRGGSLRLSLLGAPMAAGLVANLGALVPLPFTVRRLLDEDGADRTLRAAGLLGPEAAQLVRPVLAWEPPEAALAALRSVMVLAVFVVVAHTATHRTTRRAAYRALACLGALLFVVAAAHAVLDVPQVWGRFGGSDTPFHAPLVNPNHLGKVFAFFALLALGRALSIRRGAEVAAHGVVGAACVVGVVLTNSRGSLLALAVGAVALLMLLLLRRTRDVLPNGQLVVGALGTLAVAGAALTSTVGSNMVASLAALDPEGVAKSKLLLWPRAWELAQNHPLAGLAPGAFGSAFPSVLAPGDLHGSRFTYSHVENLVLQTAVDRGVVVAALLFAFAAWATWRLGRTGAIVAAPAATAAVVAVLTGELFDFVTELPVGALLLAVGLGLMAARTRDTLPSIALVPRRAFVSCAALTLAAALVTPAALADWRYHLDGALRELTGTERVLVLERAFARHPSDGQYAYELAVAARNRRDPRAALLAAERAQGLWPAHRGAHVEAARALAALGRVDQALVEYRVAWRCGWPDDKLLHEVLDRFPEYPRRRRAFPDEPDALTHLCGALVASSANVDAQRCYDELAALPSASEHQRGAHIRFALEHGDVEGAVQRADLAMRVSTPDGAVAADAARAIARKDGTAAALAHTREWSARLRDPQRLLLWRTLAALEVGQTDLVDESLAALRLGSRTPAEIDELDRTEASVHQARGQLAEALRLVARLSARSPADVELGLWQARLEQKLDLPGQASATARRLQRVWPDDARVKALVGDLDGDGPIKR